MTLMFLFEVNMALGILGILISDRRKKIACTIITRHHIFHVYSFVFVYLSVNKNVSRRLKKDMAILVRQIAMDSGSKSNTCTQFPMQAS